MIESIALNLVVFNEAHRIQQTLLRAAPHVDEIVIVDQSSTDSTIHEIDKFREFSPIPIHTILDVHHGYCEPSRIVAASETNADWILVLDADERISDEFAVEMRTIDERGYKAARLKRSFWLADHHRFTGDYQSRFFKKECGRFLDEIHTDVQFININNEQIYSPDYVAIYHEKSWAEQLRDELAYEELIPKLEGGSQSAQTKLGLNVHLQLIRDKGFTVEQVIAMSKQERLENGLDLE